MNKLAWNVFYLALRLFHFDYGGVNYADELLSLRTGCIIGLLLGQISNVKHDALLIVEDDFVALKAENLFHLIKRICLIRGRLICLCTCFWLQFLLDNLERLADESVRVPCWCCAHQAKFSRSSWFTKMFLSSKVFKSTGLILPIIFLTALFWNTILSCSCSPAVSVELTKLLKLASS